MANGGNGGNGGNRGHGRDKNQLSTWRIVCSISWLGLVLFLGVLTRIDRDLQVCKAAVAETSKASSTETTKSKGQVTTKETLMPALTETTTTCEPIGAGDLALLLLPVAVLIWPKLKGFNIAGVGLDLREFQEQVVAAAEERVIRVIIEERVGSKTVRALQEVEEGALADLPEA